MLTVEWRVGVWISPRVSLPVGERKREWCDSSTAAEAFETSLSNSTQSLAHASPSGIWRQWWFSLDQSGSWKSGTAPWVFFFFSFFQKSSEYKVKVSLLIRFFSRFENPDNYIYGLRFRLLQLSKQHCTDILHILKFCNSAQTN